MSADDSPDQTPFSLLAVLAARYPEWTIWFGEATGHWWALPPHGREPGEFIEAPTVKELVESIEALKARPRIPYQTRGPSPGAARGRLPAASRPGGRIR
jgi:hypothetical protein